MKLSLASLVLFAMVSFALVLRADGPPFSVSIAINASNVLPKDGPADGAIAFLNSKSRFHVVLTNISNKTQKPSKDLEFERSYRLTFIFTDQHGKKWIVEQIRYPTFDASYDDGGSWWLVAPGDSLVVDVDFADWEGFPQAEGKYFRGTIQAVWEYRGRSVSKPKPVRFYPKKPYLS